MARTGKKGARKVGRPKKDVAGVRRQPKATAKGTPLKRARYLLKLKLKVVELHENGMELKDIQKWLLDNEGQKISKPTICGWYKAATKRKLKELGQMCDISNETCINPQQRPRILMDLEQILARHVTRSQEKGLPLTFQAASIAGQQLYERVKMLGIYEQNGHSSASKELLTEDYITVLLIKSARPKRRNYRCR